MTEPQLREFYELLQTYRHVPTTEFAQLTDAYERLITFVNLLQAPRPDTSVFGALNPEAYEILRFPRELRGLTEEQFVAALKERMDASMREAWRRLEKGSKA